MTQQVPLTTKQWNVSGTSGFDALKFSEQPVPQLGDSEVLVKCMYQIQHNLKKIQLTVGYSASRVSKRKQIHRHHDIGEDANGLSTVP